MKLSVSLPEDDVSFVDEYVRRGGAASRSSVLHAAIELLRLDEMEDSYAAAWAEWDESEDAALWNATTGDSIGTDGSGADAAR